MISAYPEMGGQRGFQLIGNVGGKFAAELFPLLLFRHIYETAEPPRPAGRSATPG